MAIMLYQVPSGSKSSGSGWATGCFFWKALRFAISFHVPYRMRASGVGRGRPVRLRALADRRVGAAQAAFRDVQGSVRAERQPARVVQAGRKDRYRRVVCARVVDARLGARRDIASRYP
jgi:hypothetical protein